jgi:hypothetical protein
METYEIQELDKFTNINLRKKFALCD